LRDLAGVYTFSFLAVMGLFAIGNLMLKVKRKRLPRPVHAKPLFVVLAIIAVAAAFWGNIILNEESFFTFIKYLVPAILFTAVMLNRPVIVRALMSAIDFLYKPFRKVSIVSNRYLKRMQHKINSQEFVFFTKGDHVNILNKVMQYVENNETTKKLKLVNIKKADGSNEHLKQDIEVLDRAYPEINIEFIEVVGIFGPDIIDELSKKWNIPKNFMFIGSPGDKFPYKVSDLGGVRLIM
ncbi:MAG: hypothetical protein ABIP30_05325, partial [Ferruginibacter sp.]